MKWTKLKGDPGQQLAQIERMWTRAGRLYEQKAIRELKPDPASITAEEWITRRRPEYGEAYAEILHILNLKGTYGGGWMDDVPNWPDTIMWCRYEARTQQREARLRDLLRDDPARFASLRARYDRLRMNEYRRARSRRFRNSVEEIKYQIWRMGDRLRNIRRGAR